MRKALTKKNLSDILFFINGLCNANSQFVNEYYSRSPDKTLIHYSNSIGIKLKKNDLLFDMFLEISKRYIMQNAATCTNFFDSPPSSPKSSSGSKFTSMDMKKFQLETSDSDSEEEEDEEMKAEKADIEKTTKSLVESHITGIFKTPFMYIPAYSIMAEYLAFAQKLNAKIKSTTEELKASRQELMSEFTKRKPKKGKKKTKTPDDSGRVLAAAITSALEQLPLNESTTNTCIEKLTPTPYPSMALPLYSEYIPPMPTPMPMPMPMPKKDRNNDGAGAGAGAGEGESHKLKLPFEGEASWADYSG